jgi:hypothetical protein
MNQFDFIRNAMVAVSLLGLSGCYQPQGKEPGQAGAPVPRDFTQADVDAAVVTLDEQMSAPLPIALPTDCQNLTWRRFHTRSLTNASPAAADAVLVLMPGTLAGANSFTLLGEQIVRSAALEGLNIQVVSVNRRGQCLADLTGLNAAETSGDIRQAVDYYYRGAVINGRTFSGFPKGAEAAFLTDFGVQRAVEDMLTVAKAMIPSQSERQKKLFIGGHSLGANITSAFMGWDFDGDPRTSADAGYRQAAGFLRIDVSVTPKDPGADPFLSYASATTAVDALDAANRRYNRQLNLMRNGILPRYVSFPGVNAESLALLDAAAMLAHRAPDEEHTLIRDIPLGNTPKLMLRLLHSRTLNNFVTNSPRMTDFRFTNEALLGSILDDNFMPVNILQTSLGFLNGGKVTAKTFPNDPGLIDVVSGLSPFIGYILTDGKLSIAGDAGPDRRTLGQGPLYGWTHFDEIHGELRSADGSQVFTTEATEVTDIGDFARMVYSGPQSFTEWYMPARLNLDFEFLRQASALPTLNFWHYREARNAPFIDIVGDESIADPSTEPQGELVVAEGYNHLDVIAAANDRSTRRSNPVVRSMIEFARTHRTP